MLHLLGSQTCACTRGRSICSRWKSPAGCTAVWPWCRAARPSDTPLRSRSSARKGRHLRPPQRPRPRRCGRVASRSAGLRAPVGAPGLGSDPARALAVQPSPRGRRLVLPGRTRQDHSCPGEAMHTHPCPRTVPTSSSQSTCSNRWPCHTRLPGHRGPGWSRRHPTTRRFCTAGRLACQPQWRWTRAAEPQHPSGHPRRLLSRP
mmetsp:Transcript_90847/g.257226  ORF Transcript_90847/g.257226 Transcript_90847/m.257226 type:complete len:204 (-) Transcript_90847:217-828(-)